MISKESGIGITDIIALIALIIAIGSFVVSVVALQNQKTQWLNDAFIKHEADVLLEYRIAYGDAQEAINFFLNNILTPCRTDIHIKIPPGAIKREMIVKYFNAINKLNKLYNKNQHIFRKHDLEKSISCLTCFLDVVYLLPDKDLEYVLVKQDDKVKVYQLVEWDKIVKTFIFASYPILNEVKDANWSLQLLQKDPNEEFNQLKNSLSSELRSLMFKLDKITLYNDHTNKANLNVRQSKFYSDL